MSDKIQGRRTVNLEVPDSWEALSQKQLLFLFKAIAIRKDVDESPSARLGAIMTACIFKWNRLKVVCPYAHGYLVRFKRGSSREKEPFFVDAELIAAAMEPFHWLKELPKVPVRLDRAGRRHKAENTDLSGLRFELYMACENLWQGYAFTGKDECIEGIARILYHFDDSEALRPEVVLSTFYWFASLKSLFSQLYPHFMKAAPTTETEPPSFDQVRRSNDAMIRALTKGDVTKERQILDMDCHRALTELDALAREYEELQRKTNKK